MPVARSIGSNPYVSNDQYPTRDIRDVGLQAGNPGAFADLSRGTAQNVAQDVPAPSADQHQLFGQALQGLLQQYQQLGTKPFQDQSLNAQEANLGASKYLPYSLEGANPQLQDQSKQAAQSIFSPRVQGAQQDQQTFGEHIKSLGDVINRATTFNKDQETTQNAQRDDARALVKDAITQYGHVGLDLLDPKLLKTAGYNADAIKLLKDTLKDKELALKQQQAGNQDRTQIIDIAQKYPDANILATDTLEVANQKVVKNSKLYKQQTRLVGGGVSNSTSQFDANGNPVYSTIDISRYGRAANSIVKNFIGLPQYNLTANGLPYLQRIQAADSIPGSVSDAELLDSIVKLNTGGNQVTEAQVKLITGGKSYADALNVWSNKLGNGGVLSDNQRKQLTDLATKVYDRYKADYQPVYEQATKQLKNAGIPEAFWTIPDLATLSKSTKGQTGQSVIKVKNLKTGAIHPYAGTLTPEEAKAAGFEIVQ